MQTLETFHNEPPLSELDDEMRSEKQSENGADGDVQNCISVAKNGFVLGF